jgi:hypothetical protein
MKEFSKTETPDITTGKVIADLNGRGELPLLVAVEGGNGDTTGDVDALGDVGNLLKRTLNAIEDTVEEAGTELDGQGLTGAHDRVADLDTSCGSSAIASQRRKKKEEKDAQRTGLLVDLDGCLVAIDSNDLTDEVVMSDFDLQHYVSSRRR